MLLKESNTSNKRLARKPKITFFVKDLQAKISDEDKQLFIAAKCYARTQNSRISLAAAKNPKAESSHQKMRDGAITLKFTAKPKTLNKKAELAKRTNKNANKKSFAATKNRNFSQSQTN